MLSSDLNSFIPVSVRMLERKKVVITIVNFPWDFQLSDRLNRACYYINLGQRFKIPDSRAFIERKGIAHALKEGNRESRKESEGSSSVTERDLKEGRSSSSVGLIELWSYWIRYRYLTVALLFILATTFHGFLLSCISRASLHCLPVSLVFRRRSDEW